MNRFTVEETNLMCIYAGESRQELMNDITAALPYMDKDMNELAGRVLSKLDAMSNTEYGELALYPAEEV